MQEQNLPAPVGAENLPKPVEVAGVQQGEVAGSQSSETAPGQQEQVAVRGDTAVQAAPVMPTTDLPQPIAQPVHNPTNDDKAVGPGVADDVDVIEKAWVEKAKSIVKETRDDPYEQEQQVSELQTDYQKKRYGKTAEQQG